jgi:hypothetical protein
MIAPGHTPMAQETPSKQTEPTIANVRPTSFMIDLERDTAEVAVTSSVRDMAWLVSFEISPAPASPDDWNAKISAAYNTLLDRERSVATEDAISFDTFLVGTGRDPSSNIRLVDSKIQGISGAEARENFLGNFVGADMSELLLG